MRTFCHPGAFSKSTGSPKDRVFVDARCSQVSTMASGETHLPGLRPVVLPKAMRERKVLGSEPGSCIGPKCAHGGLHFSLKPMQWQAATPFQMPAPGQMPSALHPAESMPSLKWRSGTMPRYQDREPSLHDEVLQSSSSLHGNAKHQPAPAATARPADRGVEPGMVEMGNTGFRQAMQSASIKQRAVQNLATKLARQISDTSAAGSSLSDRASASKAMLHKLAGQCQTAVILFCLA